MILLPKGKVGKKKKKTTKKTTQKTQTKPQTKAKIIFHVGTVSTCGKMKIIKIQTQTDLEIKNPSEPIFTFISVKCKQKFLSSYTGVADSDNP